MRLFFLFFIGIFLISSFFSQSTLEWQSCLGGTDYEDASEVIQTTDSGYVLIARTFSNNIDVSGNHGDYDAWVVKLSSSNNIVWQRCLGGSFRDEGESIQQTSDGGYIITGLTFSNDGDVNGNHGNSDVWVVKLNSSGIIVWQKCYGGSDNEKGFSISETSDGGYFFTGSTYSFDGDVNGNHGDSDLWAVKIDLMGNIQWKKCLGGTNFDRPQEHAVSNDTGYVIIGETFSNNGDVSGYIGGKDIWIVKLNSFGNLEWQICLGGSANESSEDIIQSADGGYVLTGKTESNDFDVSGNNGSDDLWVVKVDAFGSLQWQKCLGGSLSEKGESIKQTFDGGYIIAGKTESNDINVNGNNGSDDVWVVKINSLGAFEWQKCLGGSFVDESESIYQTIDGGFILTGYTDSNDGDVSGNNGMGDVWIAKLSSFSNQIIGDTLAAIACNSYTWNGANYSSSGLYSDTLLNIDGFDSIVSLDLTIFLIPQVNAGTDQTICSGDQVTLSGSGASTYTWDNGVSDSVAFSPLSTATYTVTGTDANGCENTDQVVINVNTLPAVSGGSDVSVCIGDSTVLSGSGASSYSWDNGISDGVYFSPLFTNTYTVTGTDVNGCENTDQVDVSVNPLPTVGAGIDQTLCEGDLVTLSASGASLYLWDNNVIDGVAFNATTTTTYTVIGTDINGCENTDDVVVTVIPPPVVVALAAADTACVYLENITLSASPSAGFFTGNGVIGNTFYPPVSGLGSHDVVYSYTDLNTGCVGTDTLTIVVLECIGMNENGLSKLYIYPNPTQDQITVDINGYNGVVNVEIYDLKGRLLETTRTTTVSLRKYDRGIYIFKVSYEDITEEVRVVRD